MHSSKAPAPLPSSDHRECLPAVMSKIVFVLVVVKWNLHAAHLIAKFAYILLDSHGVEPNKASHVADATKKYGKKIKLNGISTSSFAHEPITTNQSCPR